MSTRNLPRAIIIGAISGLAATYLMDQFLGLVSSGQKALEKQEKIAAGESPWTIAHEQALAEEEAAHHEGSTEAIARKISEAAGQHLLPDQKKTAGQAVHFTFGTLMGITYAVAAEQVPEVATGGGFAYGTLLFLGADEIAVPALKLSSPASLTPPADHLRYWAAHVVYGSSLELVRKLLRRLW